MKSSSPLRFFFPDNSSLYEVDKTKPNEQTNKQKLAVYRPCLLPQNKNFWKWWLLYRLVDLMKQLTAPSSYFRFHHLQGRSRVEESPEWIGATAEQAWRPKFEPHQPCEMLDVATCVPITPELWGSEVEGSLGLWLLTIGLAPDSVRNPDPSEQDRE